MLTKCYYDLTKSWTITYEWQQIHKEKQYSYVTLFWDKLQPVPLCLELIKNLNVLIWTRGRDLRTMHKLWWKTWQDLLRSLNICNRIFVDLLVSWTISSMILEDLAKIFQVQVPSLCQDPWGCKSPSGTSKEPKIPTNS